MVRYDPAEPEHVVVDSSTFGRDITLAIVAIKLLIGGLVFAVLGVRHLRRRVANERGYRRSMIVTLAWPPPSHIVCRP